MFQNYYICIHVNSVKELKIRYLLAFMHFVPFLLPKSNVFSEAANSVTSTLNAPLGNSTTNPFPRSINSKK